MIIMAAMDNRISSSTKNDSIADDKNNAAIDSDPNQI